MEITRPAPARSLTPADPAQRTSAGVHIVNERPWPGAVVAIDGTWRRGVIGGWSQARPGDPVIIYVEWHADGYNYGRHWIHNPACVIPGERDIWGPHPPR